MQNSNHLILLDEEYLADYRSLESSSTREATLIKLKEKSQSVNPTEKAQALYVLSCHALGLEKGHYFYRLYISNPTADSNPNPNSHSYWSYVNPFNILDSGVGALASLIVDSSSYIMQLSNYRFAIEQLKQSAEYFAEANFLLGEIYRYGLFGKKQDFTKAHKYHESASNQGHAGAMFRLGMMYWLGEIQSVDRMEKTYKFISSAAKQNHIAALLWQHHLESQGIGTDKNLTNGMVALIKAVIATYHTFEENDSILATGFLDQISFEQEKNYKFLGVNFSEDLTVLSVLDDSLKLFYHADQPHNFPINLAAILENRIREINKLSYNQSQLFDNLKLDELINYIEPYLLDCKFFVPLINYLKKELSYLDFLFADFLAEQDIFLIEKNNKVISSSAFILAEFKAENPQPIKNLLAKNIAQDENIFIINNKNKMVAKKVLPIFVTNSSDSEHESDDEKYFVEQSVQPKFG